MSKLTKHVIEQSAPISDFKWMSKGSTAMYVVKRGEYFTIQKTITSAFTIIGGKVKTQTYIVIDPKTGESNHLVIATVLTKGRDKQKRGVKHKR